MNLWPRLADHCVYVCQDFTGFRGVLSKILNKRFKLHGQSVYVLQRRMHLRASIRDQSASFRQRGRKIGPITVA